MGNCLLEKQQSIKLKAINMSKQLNHSPSGVEVFQTDDYKQFNLIKGNRSLDMHKIKKIMADIERGTNLLKYCPVLVVENDGKLDIIDGQHRYTVAKKVKSPVYYILAETLSLYDIARMNSNTEKWKAADFINCYKELGNTNYIKLEKFLQDFPGIAITVAITLLSAGKVQGGVRHANLMEKFHRGEFVVETEDTGWEFCSKVSLFNFDGKYSRPFMLAIEKVFNAGLYGVDELATKVNDNAGMLQTHDHWRKYLTNLEEIASKGKQKRVAIY